MCAFSCALPSGDHEISYSLCLAKGYKGPPPFCKPGASFYISGKCMISYHLLLCMLLHKEQIPVLGRVPLGNIFEFQSICGKE